MLTPQPAWPDMDSKMVGALVRAALKMQEQVHFYLHGDEPLATCRTPICAELRAALAATDPDNPK